jgi:rhodanese-related sulfurtransferase/transcriptional regulator with XRE-family HTH domain
MRSSGSSSVEHPTPSFEETLTRMKILSVRELRELLDRGGVDLVDVREPEEWLSGHLPGARLVPLAQLRADPRGALPNDDVVFVCAKGGRSAAAAELAESAGKTRVYSLDGGTLGWASAGFEIVLPARPAAPHSKVAEADDDGAPVEPDSPALDALVAVNLRAQRAALGWSLDDLAREAGVSRTLLGQIEIGRAAPSIGVVWKIAQTLGVPFSALLATEPRAGEAATPAPVPRGATSVTHRASAKRLLSADGRFSSRALFALNDPSSPEFYELWLAPHSHEDAEAHRPGTRENLVVTAGTLELHVGRDVRTLHAGDAAIFTADVAHRYVNPSREECWFYLVMSYPRG